ncbi:alpha/beta-hydrolase [Polyplosphaeria fusca]|uniref:Alpha/beta-hydrolase n=1 Tax=Polyplosphaeria fusca TaxID=682080 RepID=A0A9P4UY80_9PLEO|nr:alpha/beta-hydrolase [Polyplosphaeria fusca]
MDFSHYGGASEEFLEIQRQNPMDFDLTLPVPVMKQAVNAFREATSAEAMKTLGPKVTMADYSIPTRDGSTIEARSYRPKSVDANEPLPIYMHLHGGGFLFGTLSADDAQCSLIATRTSLLVLSINYRHTPDHTFPTAWHDAQDAFAWLHAHTSTLHCSPSHVIVGGISAGAQLAASLVLEKHIGTALQNLPPIAGQLLMIPCLSHPESFKHSQLKQLKDPSASSYEQNKDAPILPLKMIRFFIDLLQMPSPPDLHDTKCNPGNATPEQVRGMPKTVFGIAGLDPLRDEGLLYAKMLAENGVPVKVNLFKGVPHGFTRFGGKLRAVRDWEGVVEGGLGWILEGKEGEEQGEGGFEVKVWE